MYGHHTWQTWPFGHMASWSHVTNKKRYISASTRPMTAKIDKVDVYSKGPPSIESFDALITWPSYHTTDGKPYISTSAGPMATKVDRVVGSNVGLLSIKSYNLLITWSYKVTWQMKKCYKFTFSWPVAIKVDRRVTYDQESYVQPQSHIFLRSRGYVSFLLLLNLTGWWLVMRSHHSKSSLVLWSRDHL